jgi:hypothetical protein
VLVALYGAPAIVDAGFGIEARISSISLVPESRGLALLALAAIAALRLRAAGA